MKLLPFLLTLAALSVYSQSTSPGSQSERLYQAEADSAQRRFEYLQKNGAQARPDPKPISLTENELNAWLSSRYAQLPQGVKKLRVHGESGVINANAFVDFDEITARRQSSNPMLSLFHGTHEVQATAHAAGSGGQGRVDIDSVALDGIAIPRMAVEYFVDKYIKPKHPEIGMNTVFKLPNRIDSAAIGNRQLTLTQK